jgi:hypothetical protein
MTGRMLRVATVAAIAAAVTTGVARAVTPANGGDAGGTTITINNHERDSA